MFLKRVSLILLTAACLNGCVFVAGAAAGAAAIAIVFNHQTLENTLQDTQLANRIIERLHSYPYLKLDCHIEVTVFHDIVLLTGETPKLEWRNQAEEITKSVDGVSQVYNQLTLEGPTSTLIRTSDSWVTTKIKSEMLATDDLKSGSIKVVTENGTVFLMGVVSKRQADKAVEIARRVSGVQKVIKVFKPQK